MKLQWSIVLLALAIPAHAEQVANTVTAYAQWRMSLDSDGKITALVLQPGRVKDVLRESLEKAIYSWEFEPGKVNGEPAATETSLMIKFTASVKSDASGFAVRIDSVDTGGAIKSMAKMPRFSSSFAYHSAQSLDNPLVVLDITYDSSGVPERVVVADGSPLTKGSLVDSAVYAIRTWRFEPERVAGHGIRARAIQPVCFDDNPRTDKCNWKMPGSDSQVVDQSQRLALDSQVRLKSSVIGKTL
jgi:hypothetical protein